MSMDRKTKAARTPAKMKKNKDNRRPASASNGQDRERKHKPSRPRTKSAKEARPNNEAVLRQEREELIESRQRLLVTYERAPVGIVECSLEGKYINVNEEFCRISGYEKDELLSRGIKDLTHEEDYSIDIILHQRLVEDKIPSYQIEKRYVRKDGGIIWAELTRNVVRDSDGKALYTIGAVLDVTERKRAEEALQLARQQAERTAGRIARLQEVTEKLSESLTPLQVAQVVVEQGAPTLGAVSATVTLLAEDGETLEMVYSTVQESVARPYQRFSRSIRVPTADAVRSGQPVWIESRQQYRERYPHLAEQITAWGQQAAVAIPMVDKGRTLGVLSLSFERVLPYTPEDESYMLTLARQGAQALERARLYETEQQARQVVTEFARQQDALYRLVNQMDRTNSLEDLFNAALDAILSALQCDRASILLVDAKGVMRFVAWNGLSDEYRKATDGHSPWKQDEKNPEPICMNDIDTADLSDSLRAVIKGEGIGSLAFIPLVSNGKLIGKFMMYYNAAHAFTEEEIQLSLTIARQLAFGIDRKQAEEKIRQIASFDEAIVESMSEGLYTVDSEGKVTSLNPAAEKMFGWTFGELRGRRMHDVTHYKHADGTSFPIEDCAGFQVLHHGQKLTGYEDVFIRKDGTFLDVIYSSSPFWENGKINGLVVVFSDNTARKQAEKRLVLLSEISELVRILEDPNELLYAFSKAVGDHLQVKRCLFNEIDVENDLEIVHRDYCRGVESVEGVHRVSDYSSVTSAEMAVGKTVVNYDSKTDARTAPDYERSYVQYGERAYVAVPLMRENRWVASLWVSDDVPREWSHEEISLLETVAERTWTAIEKLRIDAALRASEEEKRSLNNELRAQLDEINSLLAILPTGVWVGNHDCSEITGNPAAYQMLGLPPGINVSITSPEPQMPTGLRLFVSGVEVSAEDAPMQQVARTGKPVYNLEHDLLFADGRRISIQANIVPLFDQDGAVRKVIASYTDITERKKVEETLRASEALYRAIARSIPGGGIYVVDKDLRYLVAEGVVTEAFGLTREKLEGHTIWEVLSNEIAAKMEERFRRTFAGETISYETKHNGRVYWTQQALMDNSLGHVIVVTIDVTQRKQMEEALRESEERFSAILRQATAGIVRKDHEGRFVYVNQAFCNMLGYTAADLLGKTVWEFMHEDDIAENKRSFDRLLAGGIPFKLERRFIRRDGSMIWVDASVSPIMDASGQPQSAVAVEVDITGRKQAEATLQQLNLQLENRVQSRTEKLNDAIRALREEINERKQVEEALYESRQHLQVLSQRLVEVQEEERRAIARELHDRVGQSLSALNINLIIMRDQLSPDSVERIGSRLDDAMNLVGETITLVRDVMTDLRPAVLDDYGLEAALQSYIDEYSSRYEIKVRFDHPDQEIPRLGASLEMTLLRITQEALTNIARHAQADQASVSLQLEDSVVHLLVLDNGVGMAALQETDRFDSHGLKIMRERAQAFGGTVNFESAPGKGTKVDARIPIENSGQNHIPEEKR